MRSYFLRMWPLPLYPSAMTLVEVVEEVLSSIHHMEGALGE